MFVINEKPGEYTNFIAPLIMVALGPILLPLFKNLVISGLILSNFTLELDPLITSLFLTFISQICSGLLSTFILIPRMGGKEVNMTSQVTNKYLKVFLAFCLLITISTVSNYIFVGLFAIFNVIPQSGYSTILLDTSQINPLNVFIYYIPFTIGAPFYEEILYRRIIIPMLEKRGMSPLSAVFYSSILFSVAHLSNDLINGNLFGGIMHCINVFYISMVLGFLYIYTRKIIIPIIIHGVVNFISFSSPLISILGIEPIIVGYDLLIFFIIIIGIGVLFYCIWYFYKRKTTGWMGILRQKSKFNIKSGCLFFLIIGVIVHIIPIIIEVFSVIVFNLSNFDVVAYLTFLLISYSILALSFYWLAIRTSFISQKMIENDIILELNDAS